jgi:hypothetical protein
MSVFKYKPYYQYNGPTKSDPLREELSPEEAENRIKCFFEEIKNYFKDDSVAIKKEGDLVSITGKINQMDCDEAVKKCLNSLDLFANKTS